MEVDLRAGVKTLVWEYLAKQADKDGQPSHGRHFDIEAKIAPLFSHSATETSLVKIVMESYLTGEAKANVLVIYADTLQMASAGGDTDLLSDIVSFIKSLVSVGQIPQYPIWCLPNYIPITDTRAQAEVHYINRNKAIMNLGRAGDGDKLLYRFLTNYWEYMYIDSRCLCELLSESRPEGNRLRIKKDFGQGKVGRAVLVQDQQDNPYIMKIMKTGIGHDKSPFTLAMHKATPDNLVSGAISVKIEGGSQFLAAGSDNFTNQTVIHILLNLLLDDSPNYIHQHDAFICNGNGVNIMDIANQGDMYGFLQKLPDDKSRLEACESCLSQLLPIIAYLKRPEIGFMHNDLKLKNVFVHQQAGSAPTYTLADFDKSSISWRCVRFYNNSRDYCLSGALPYRGLGSTELSGGICSKVVRNTDAIGKATAVYTMFNAEGYYLGYDIYTLVASMLFHPSVYAAYRLGLGDFMHRTVDVLCNIEGTTNFMDIIRVYMDTEGRKTQGETLQSITAINGILHKNNVRIRNDCDAIVRELGLVPFTPSKSAGAFYAVTADKSVKPLLSKSGKVCLSDRYKEASQTRCKTPSYRGWSGTYDYDQMP
jgi:serine/threonine protein kinase